MRTSKFFLLISVFVLSFVSFSFADQASLQKALNQVKQLPVEKHYNLPPYPERLAKLMTENGRLAELGLSADEGVIYAEGVLRHHGITPRYFSDDLISSKDPSANAKRTPGEFEPVAGVIIHYPYGASTIYPTFDEMLAELDGLTDLDVYFLVNNATEESRVQTRMSDLGLGGTNFSYYRIHAETVWTRDYGPIFVEEFPEKSQSTQGGVDMDYFYNTDDAAAGLFLEALELPSYDLNLDFEGGNYMSDGAGTCFTSTGLYTYNPGLTEEDAQTLAADYWGCEQLVNVQPLIGEGTTHIDMYSKLLDANTVMVGQVEEGDTNYERLESIVDQFESTNNLGGEPYTVVRVPMPDMYEIYDPYYGDLKIFRSYTNSLILNNMVLVPIYNIDLDEDGLAAYENFYSAKDMDVIGIDSEEIIEWLGAVHCVTMEHSAYGWSLHSGDDDDDDDVVDDDDDDTADDDDAVDDDDESDDDDASDDDSGGDDDDDDDGCCG